jgi:hypothetical protein
MLSGTVSDNNTMADNSNAHEDRTRLAGTVLAEPQDIQCYAFSGRPEAVARRLYALNGAVVECRFFALLLQGEARADIRIYERAAPGDRSGQVATWQGTSLDVLPGSIATLVMGDTAMRGPDGQTGSAGQAGPRERVKSALRQDREFTDWGVVPCPPTPRGAFGHPLRQYANDRAICAFVIAV